MRRRGWILKLPGGRWLQWTGAVLWYTKNTELGPGAGCTRMRRLWSRQKIEKVECHTS